MRVLEDLLVRILGDSTGARTEIGKATKAVDQLKSHVERQMAAVNKALAAFGIALTGAAAAGFTRKVVDITAEFQRLKASLATVTGSAAGAEAAFARIQKFAKETPFSVREVTEAFVRLKALGLDAGEDALRSYGNTASAMGRNVLQFIEAVADAATGEFERLKEFGIKAKSQGDEVTFTFQGVSTTVRKTSADIENYLRQIGEVQFAGAMARQMQTLGGALSNLQDSVESFLFQVGEGGLGQAVSRAANALGELAGGSNSAAAALGQGLGAAIDVLAAGATTFLTVLGDLLRFMQPLIDVAAALASVFGQVVGALNDLGVAAQVVGVALALAFGPAGVVAGIYIFAKSILDAVVGTEELKKAIAELHDTTAEIGEAFRTSAVTTREQAAAYLQQALAAYETNRATRELIRTLQEASEAGSITGLVESAGQAGLKKLGPQIEELETLEHRIAQLQNMLATGLFQTAPGGGGGGGSGGGIDKTIKKFKEIEQSLVEQTQQLRFQATLVGKTTKEVEYQTKRRELLLAFEETGKELTADTLLQIENWSRAYADAKVNLDDLNQAQTDAKRLAAESVEAATKAAEDFQQEVRDVAEEISSDLTEFVFEGGKTAFEDLLGYAKDWVRRLGLQLLESNLVLPITTQLVGSFPGLFGISGAGGITGSQALGGAGGNGFDLFGQIGGFLSKPLGSFFGGGSGPQSILPTSLGGSVGSFGSSLGALSFGDFLGGAGAGAGIGSLLFGLGIGKTSIGTSIGGALGGALGTLATPFLGPLGPIAGGLLGGLFGGLFGNNKPSNRGQGSLVDLSSGSIDQYGLSGKKFSQENRDIAVKLGEDLVAFNQMVEALTGLASTATLGFHVGDRDPLRLTGPGGKNDVLATFGKKSEENVARLQDASFQALVESIGGLDPAMKAAIERSIDLRETMEEIAQDFSVIKLVLGESEDELTGAAAALKELNDSFDEAAKRAKELGLSEAVLNQKRAEAIQDLKTGFLEGIQDQILAIQDPVAAALKEFEKTAEQWRQDAMTLGVGLVEVEQLIALRRQQIVEDFGQRATAALSDTLQQFLEEITFGGRSGASPTDQLAGARAAFEAAAAQALAGDTSARDRIAELGGTYLDASRAFNASGQGFYEDRQRVEDVVRAILGDLPGHAAGTMNAPGGWRWIGEQGPELMRIQSGSAILPNQISRMVASAANGALGGDGELTREGVKLQAQILRAIDRGGERQAKLEDQVSRLLSQMGRLLSKLPAVA